MTQEFVSENMQMLYYSEPTCKKYAIEGISW